MRSPETAPTMSNPVDRHHGRSGEGCESAPDRAVWGLPGGAFRPLPGIRAYKLSCRPGEEGRVVPGFEARTYRDFGHIGPCIGPGSGTGISGTLVPGFEAHGYRDSGHGGAGTWGTNEPAATGIPGTFPGPKCMNRLGFPARNFVSINSCNNSPTRVGHFLVRGRGTWPGTE